MQSVGRRVRQCAQRLARHAQPPGARTAVLASNGHKKEREVAAAATNTAVCEDDSGALWRRDILMGERCEPLNFSGAIHYDSQGRPIWQPRRRAMAAKMLCRSSNVVDDAVVTYPRK
ncbi:hypothetical protein ZWY2020_006997 [Hordeum vulgare]|nr:hypothetical protein ZWY2020_006997 [Hordeum vulgare]